jgi:cytochrome c553
VRLLNLENIQPVPWFGNWQRDFWENGGESRENFQSFASSPSESEMKNAMTLFLVSALFLAALASAQTLPPAFASPNLSPVGVRALAANCAPCHGTNGASAGGAIAGLAGMNKEYLVDQMKLFKEGKRVATVMQQLAKGYSAVEIEAIAGYFAERAK